MPSLGTITIAGLVVLALLVWFLLRTLRKDHLEEMIRKRSGSCRLTGKADFVEGPQRIPVAIAMDDRCFYYENPDMEASVDLERIEEIEYDDELLTGTQVDGRVMRLRSHGHAFEFVLDMQTAAKWKNALPPHLLGQSAPAAEAS